MLTPQSCATKQAQHSQALICQLTFLFKDQFSAAYFKRDIGTGEQQTEVYKEKAVKVEE